MVVGAGLSGLTCADRLRQQGLTVRLLEASERWGGRLMGYTTGAGLPLDPLDWSARAGQIDITSALEYSSPVYVAMLAYVFLGERLSRRQVAGVLSALTGILLMVALPSPSKTSRMPTACTADCQPMRHPISHRLR